jgi:uncharacterized protein (TIGR02421 family)
MFDPRVYEELDRELIDIGAQLKTLTFCEPVNIDEEKDAFLKGKQNPEFRYRSLDDLATDPKLKFNPATLEARLNSLVIPSDEIGTIYERKRQNQVLELMIILNRGNPSVVMDATVSMHGIPSEELVHRAGAILEHIQPLDEPKVLLPQVIMEKCLAAVEHYGITDWTVEIAEKKKDTVTRPPEKKLVIGNKNYSEKDAFRLPVHEVGVHVVRSVNGYEQPLKIFALGLPGYTPTDEGLASYCEELTNTTDGETLRKYAARVLAVNSGLLFTFRETFEMLRLHGLTENQAWDYTVRVYRGGDGRLGAYIKDHEYLSGVAQVEDFVRDGGSLRDLYIGKIGVSDVPLAKRLVDQGLFRPPKIIPEFIAHMAVA